MPVTLATLAIDRSISAQRITKVRPTAMMPGTETWVRMLLTLSSVANEGLATAKKPLRQISVRNGAILRICERNHAAILRGGLRSAAATLTLSPATIHVSSRAFQEAVRAHLFVAQFAPYRGAVQYNDAIGERQNCFGLGREDDDG